MKIMNKGLLATAAALACAIVMVAQPPAGGAPKGGAPGKGGGGKGKGGPVFTVTSPSFVDGGEVPVKHSFYGENKSPQFDFHWVQGGMEVEAPMTLQSYAIIFHDMENASAKGPEDTLHWSVFNIPGTAKSLPEGLAGGDLPDGTRHGPGIGAGRGMPSYFGPGAGPGPFHHYMFEFYALDTKLELPATTTRDAIWEALKGHVIGKAVYGGRFHQAAP